jgi:hypothetical protein
VPSNTATGGGSGAGEAIVGTLLGVAAGAALHYAFSNRSKDTPPDDDRDAHKFQPARPSMVGRSMTEPPAIMRPEYSSVPSDYHAGYVGGDGGFQRAIEPAPSAYTYSSRNHDDQKLITMHDNDPSPPAPTAITYHSHASPKSDYASTIRPATVTRRMSMDSGFGPGPRDIEVASHASSKASRHSKKSGAPPPTSYRAPTALTEKMSKVSSAKGDGKEGSRSRASSLTRLGRSLSQAGRSLAGDQPRPRSQSRHSTRSRRSRRDDFEAVQGEVEEAETVLHVGGGSVHNKSTTYAVSSGGSKAGSKAPSRASSRHSRAKDPAEYPLPPSRAATWTGSDAGRSFVSARSNLGPNGRVDGPRTIIGRLRGEQVEKADTASVVSKQKDLKDLDVTDREVGPEDSVSQISVESRRSRRSKASSRR